MAQYDSEKLQLAVADMIAVSVGDKLSTEKMDVNGNGIVDVPSIILAHSMSPDGKPVTPPPYPFVMLEDTSPVKAADEINQYLDENNNLIRETTITARVNVKVFGTVRDKVINIVLELDQSFVIDDYRDMIEDGYESDCRWITNSDTLTTQTVISEVYQEVSTFDAYFSITRQHIQENVDTFDTILTEGEILHIDGTPIQ